MDDPWGNAWADPTNPVHEEPKSPNLPSWTKTVRSDDQEADIGMPSWSTGAGIQWDEPSNHENLWTQSTDTQEAWKPSPYDHLPIGKGSSFPDPPHIPELGLADESQPVSPIVPPVETQVIPNATMPPDSPSSPQTPKLATPSPPDTPDPFGTFESGLHVEGSLERTDDDPWALAGPTISQSEEWSNASWRVTEAHEEEIRQTINEPLNDEWETARIQKEKQDSQIPPELLATILRELDELAFDVWPDYEPDGQEDSAEKEWMTNWRSGMEGVEGLSIAMDKFLPPDDMTLPPPAQFGKTATAKNMADAIRLTRNVALTKMSPMAHFLASKGSTAWEAEVKSRPAIVQDDLLPVGWRVVEKDEEQTSSSNSDISKGKKASGLLSFWSRKAQTIPISVADEKVERTTSPVQTSNKPLVKLGSPRPSLDSANPPNTKTISSAATLPSIASAAVASSSQPSRPASTTVVAAFPDPDPPAPAPSVVSRFLNRFSRPNTTDSSGSRKSLALSSDDLEFLSDVVPSATDDEQGIETDSQLGVLSTMIDSKPVLTAKLPPPLAPPPSLPRHPHNESKPKSHSNDAENLFDLNEPNPAQYSSSLSQLSAKLSLSPSPPSTLLDQGQFYAPPIPKKPLMEPIRAADFSLPSPVAPPPASSRPRTPVLMPTRYPPSQTSKKPMTEHVRAASLSSSSKVRSDMGSSIGVPNSLFAFTSSSQPSSNVSITSRAMSPADKHLSQFALTPPPSSRPQTPVTIFPLPSSQSSFSDARIPPPISQFDPYSGAFEVDDFSDFHSPAIQPSHHPDSILNSSHSPSSLFSSSDQSQFLRNGSSSNPRTPPKPVSFNGLDDFISSPLRSPSPPPPPSKSTPIKQRYNRPPQGDHARTGSLVDSATTHRDSSRLDPLPPRLPPPLPPPGTSSIPSQFDLLGNLTPTKDGKAQADRPRSNFSLAATPSAASTSGGTSHFKFPPPPAHTFVSPPPGSTLGSKAPTPVRPLAASTVVSSTRPTNVIGGLSAQDLSFFEGL